MTCRIWIRFKGNAHPIEMTADRFAVTKTPAGKITKLEWENLTPQLLYINHEEIACISTREEP